MCNQYSSCLIFYITEIQFTIKKDVIYYLLQLKDHTSLVYEK